MDLGAAAEEFDGMELILSNSDDIAT